MKRETSKLPEAAHPVWVRVLLPPKVHRAARIKALTKGQPLKDWLRDAVADCAGAQ